MKMTFAIALLLGALGTASHAQGTLWGGHPYLQRGDSPFATPNAYLLLENFEDGAFNLPGVTASTGFVMGPGPTTDSVDGDDGLVDGSGNGGFSYCAESGIEGITFVFDASVLGALPNTVGIVWTDGAPQCEIAIEAYDAEGLLISGGGSAPQGDGDLNGGTDEDRFMGVFTTVAISSIHVSATPQLGSDAPMEIDHLQLGALSPWISLGNGLAGSFDVPFLWGTGALEPDAPVTVMLSAAQPGVAGSLVIGASTLSTPFHGGVLVPSPDVIVPVVPDDSGNWAATFRWPVGASEPLTLQAWFPDAGSRSGFSASNALQAGLPWAF